MAAITHMPIPTPVKASSPGETVVEVAGLVAGPAVEGEPPLFVATEVGVPPVPPEVLGFEVVGVGFEVVGGLLDVDEDEDEVVDDVPQEVMYFWYPE